MTGSEKKYPIYAEPVRYSVSVSLENDHLFCYNALQTTFQEATMQDQSRILLLLSYLYDKADADHVQGTFEKGPGGPEPVTVMGDGCQQLTPPASSHN